MPGSKMKTTHFWFPTEFDAGKGGVLIFQVIILPKYIFPSYHWTRTCLASLPGQKSTSVSNV